MARRSRAREVALQLLYECDHSQMVEPDRAAQFFKDRLRSEELVAFARTLFHGSMEWRRKLDHKLGEVAENWKVERMAAVDRNILRIGAFELLHQPETPPQVVMNEAIELARRYGTAESPAFVNGVLDKLAAGMHANVQNEQSIQSTTADPTTSGTKN